jgi:hypothetical protein
MGVFGVKASSHRKGMTFPNVPKSKAKGDVYSVTGVTPPSWLCPLKCKKGQDQGVFKKLEAASHKKINRKQNYFYFQALNEMTYEKIASTYFPPPML